ncbi:hypothetical protein M422DRAFT_254687 [Sphaerobolus stellatus SS14]|uniref:Uncharacterized protein n=1 Tax=Sphaerobolus stellatus (strain SS14) TaxID=990650 RepID=A0A0C9UGU0_SPHS4|nr:hypothetical protein M422DRAFT_254687 [Sphaerobolus stellatus SS14]
MVKTPPAVETSHTSGVCPRLEMPRCSPSEICMVDLMADGAVCVDGRLVKFGESMRVAVGGVAEIRVDLRCYLDGHRATTTVYSTKPSLLTFCAHTLAMERKIRVIPVLGGADE